MRAVAPFVPIAVALATLSIGALQAVAQESMVAPPFPLLAFMIIVLGTIPYVIPILLLEWIKSVRLRSAAPPAVGRAAVALALPALMAATLWPLSVGIALLLHRTPVAHALLVDHRLACAAVWAASVAVTALWIVGAVCRWVWWARPVAVVGTPPYR